jgi:putative peptidoglycan lipid II flippase
MNLLGALARVSGFTLLSRITGLAREFLIARAFGASLYTDAFFVAFRIPNLLRRLFAEGAFSQAFVPILSQTRNAGDEAETRSLIDHTFGMMALILGVTTLLGVIAAPLIIYVSAPGFAANAPKFAVTVTMLKLTFPYILFIALTAFAGAVLNTWSRFSVPAFTPVLLNLSFIGCALWLAPHVNPPVLALAWAVLLGGVLQLAFQWPALRKIGMVPRFRFDWRHPGVRRILRQMAPALFGVSVAQVSLLLNTIIASFLVSGSVSWLYYADRLMEFPAGLLGVALGTILLPSLSKAAAETDGNQFSASLDWGLRLTFLLALPAALGLGMLATPLVTTLYHYGAFSSRDVEQTCFALAAYSVGLIGLILVKVLAPGFYARGDIRTPVKIAVATLVLTQLMNLAFVGVLKHAGLALALGLGACTNAFFLWRGLRRSGSYQPQAGWAAFYARVALALLAMGAALWMVDPGAARWIAMRAVPFERVAWLAGIVSAGILVYFASLWVLGFRIRDFKRTV